MRREFRVIESHCPHVLADIVETLLNSDLGWDIVGGTTLTMIPTQSTKRNDHYSTHQGERCYIQSLVRTIDERLES